MGFTFGQDSLPSDHPQALLVGRADLGRGPVPVILRDGVVEDVSETAQTVADLLDLPQPGAVRGRPAGGVEGLSLLSPIDLQTVKACGVTFAVSALERVIEERARGDFSLAAALRGRLEARIGGGIRAVVPGSAEAAELKAALIDEGMWSQYLEVAIGPDAEVFTKAATMSTMGWGAEIGIRSDSGWNNPEPEVVLVVNAAGRIMGATLGNDVNLRDFEGRSALLLGKAKDNNASCALGPFIRLFDDGFTLDDVGRAVVELVVEGADNYRLEGRSSMDQISRSPEELVRQTLSEHQYPDGFALFLGTLFAPTDDRDEPGRGFTHKMGDVVTISTPRLGRLLNRVTTSRDAPPWTFGIRELYRSIAARQAARA